MENPALKIFSDNRTAAKFWFLLFSLLCIGNLVQGAYIVKIMKKQDKIVVIGDDRTIHVAVAKNIDDAEEEKKFCTWLAVKSLFERNPAGFDNPDLMKQLFRKPALDQIEEFFRKDKELFEKKKLHQDCKLADSPIFLDIGRGIIIANVKVSLQITGSFGTNEIRHVKEVDVTFNLHKNPDIGNNGRLLYAVDKVEIKESK